MPVRNDSLSVLVVDDEPEILAFFARLMDGNGLRALLARTPEEAIGIAQRGYVPIDLVLTDISLKTDSPATDAASGLELVNRLRELRPSLRALYMTAFVDSEVIRIELMSPSYKSTSDEPDDLGLIETIRGAAVTPLTHRAGSTYRQ